MGRLELGEVLAASQLGQPWALRLLYDELAPQVHGYFRARGAAEPDELTNDLFLTVIKTLPTLTGGVSGLRTFVFSVAHARLVDALRRQARRPAGVEYQPVCDTRQTASAEDEAELRASADRAGRLLATLPEDQRTVLALRIVGDLTLDEVAAAIGRSQGAVKQLQRRALLALKRELAVHA